MQFTKSFLAVACVAALAGCGEFDAVDTGGIAPIVPPHAMISGTVYVDSVPAPGSRVELIGWLDSGRTASTPLGTQTTDGNGRYTFDVQPEAHHCGRMSAQALPSAPSGGTVSSTSPDMGTHFPIQCGTTSGLDFHFQTGL